MKDLRREYNSGTLHKADLKSDPFLQFDQWFKDCMKSEANECNSMVLSTISSKGKPSSRVVLLKEINEDGLVFFSNYNSRKALEIQSNPNACLLFYWSGLERQIRIEGKIEKISASASEEYFYSRPLLSQISAIVSNQSAVVENRTMLERQFEDLRAQPDRIKKPDQWGGYRLIPDYFEFWQGRENRLHDRFSYALSDNFWIINRLAP